VSSDIESEPKVFRVGGVSYLRIPAEDPHRSAAFYEAVFGWRVRGDRDDPSFEDGTGHVIGHFMRELSVAGEAGSSRTSSSRAWTKRSRGSWCMAVTL